MLSIQSGIKMQTQRPPCSFTTSEVGITSSHYYRKYEGCGFKVREIQGQKLLKKKKPRCLQPMSYVRWVIGCFFHTDGGGLHCTVYGIIKSNPRPQGLCGQVWVCPDIFEVKNRQKQQNNFQPWKVRGICKGPK